MRLSQGGIALISILLSCGLTVRAEQPMSLFDLSLEELLQVEVTSTSSVIVTQKDTAASVTVAQPNRWERLGSRNLGELLATFPSTSISPGFGANRLLAVRGYLTSSSSSGNAILLDGIPLSTLRESHAISSIDSYALTGLSQVEMVRGPGSALHGADAFHSVISLTTAEISDETDSQFWLDVGSENYRSAAFTAGQNSEKQGLMGHLHYSKIGDQQLTYHYLYPDLSDSGKGVRSGEQETINGQIKYRLNHGDIETQLNAYWFQVDSNQLPGADNSAGIIHSQDKDWSNYQSQTGITKLTSRWNYSSRHQFQLNGYYWLKQDEFQIDSEPLAVFNFFTSIAEQRQESHWGIELTGYFFHGDQNYLTYGYQYRHAGLDNFSSQTEFADGSYEQIIRPESGYDLDTHSLLLDGKFQFEQWPWQLSYGIRLDEYENFGLQASPRLSLLWPLAEQHRVSLNLSRAFRKPNVFELFGSPVFQGNPTLKPETLSTLELAYQQTRHNWLFNAVAFYNKWQNAIRSTIIDSSDLAFGFDNNGEQKSYGLELETKGRWPDTELNLTASYIRSQNVSNQESYDAFPRWQFQIDTSHQLSEKWSLLALARYHYRTKHSEGTVLQQGSERSTHYLRVDLSSQWQYSESLTYQASIANLLDRKNFLPGFFGLAKSMPDNGRHLKLHLRWTF